MRISLPSNVMDVLTCISFDARSGFSAVYMASAGRPAPRDMLALNLLFDLGS